MQKHVNLVDLVNSFPTCIFLQNLVSIQPITIPIKHRPEIFPIHATPGHCSCASSDPSLLYLSRLNVLLHSGLQELLGKPCSASIIQDSDDCHCLRYWEELITQALCCSPANGCLLRSVLIQLRDESVWRVKLAASQKQG